MKKTERQDKILESAARLFSSRRFDEVLMDDIAREAGVAKGTLYTYFPDKEELYFAVVFDGISKLNERLNDRVDKDIDPEKELREMMHAIISFFAQNRFFFRLMSIEDSKNETGKGLNRQRWREERRKQMAAIEAVLQRGIGKGIFEIRHLKIEARILRDMVRSVLQGREEQLSVDEMVDVIMRIFLCGVQKRS